MGMQRHTSWRVMAVAVLAIVLGVAASAGQANALEFGGGGGITWDSDDIEAGGEVDWTIPSAPIPLYPPLFLNLGAGFAIKAEIKPGASVEAGKAHRVTLSGTGLPAGEDESKRDRDLTMNVRVELTVRAEDRDGRVTETAVEAEKSVKCRTTKGRKPNTVDAECSVSITLVEKSGGKVDLQLR